MATMTAIFCFRCGVEFHIATAFNDDLQNDHRKFWCPNGHDQHYVTETRAEQLAKRLEAQQAENNRIREERDKVQRQLDAEKKRAQRAKRRTANGVCLCCHRTFSNVAEHMKKQHPKFLKESVA